MRAPSTAWREQIAADEEQRFKGYADEIAALQKRMSQKFGTGRALHRKQVLGIRGELEVLSGLPVHAAQGMFARPGTHEAWVRLSNGGWGKQSDRTPDIRGFAIKVRGIEGPGALGGATQSQDFLLINREAFSTAKSDEFVPFVLAASRGVPAILKFMISRYGFFAGLKRVAAMAKGLKRPFTGFATERFFSAAPLACGPYAARVRLLPASDRPTPGADQEWAADMRARLAAGPLVHQLQLQFFVDEAITPIEDASVDWPESEAPYVTVARLTLPQQDLADAASSFQREVEQHAFDPWNALESHRPLGDVMRARKVAYFVSETGRGATGG